MTMEYQFTLHYRLAETDNDFDAIVERLGEAGCDDALVGMGLPGCLGLDFVREAKSAEAAMRSALADVRQAIPAAELIEAVPDFVGLSDAADVVGVSRQNLRKLMVNHASFPSPVHMGSTSLWHLEDVMLWLEKNQRYELEPGKFEVAHVARQINSIKQTRQLTPKVEKSFASLVL